MQNFTTDSGCRRAELMNLMERAAEIYHRAWDERTKQLLLSCWNAAVIELAEL
jgi:hypothetical protein